MSLESLLSHVAQEHRAEVRRRYADYVQAGTTMPGDHIDTFAISLVETALLTKEKLNEFLTFRALNVASPRAPEDIPDDAASRGRYELETVLGRGGMGEVFIATEPSLKRTIAVKRLHKSRVADSILHRRFVTEAQITAQLDHPAIVPIYGLERDSDGALIYAMKLVRGLTLADRLAQAKRKIAERDKDQKGIQGSLSLKARVETFVPVLNALAYAHRRGVIHRDLKPENVMVGRFGEVLVMDWGIARVIGAPGGDVPTVAHPLALTGPPGETQRNTLGEDGEELEVSAPGSEGITRKGAILGTPDFMSPEQARGEVVDAASDQYALGLMLQEVVTLEPPIPGRSADAIHERAKRGERAPIQDGVEKVPREIRAIIAKATAFAKADRYPSVEDMAEDVRRFLRDESVNADPDSGLRTIKRWIGNHRDTAVAVGAGLVLLVFAVTALFAWRNEVALQAEREAAHAREEAITALQSKVDGRGKEMIQRLHVYERLLAKLAASMRFVMSEPAPPSNVLVHKYRDGKPEPPTIPEDARPSEFYRTTTSLRHADYAAAPDVDLTLARPEIDQLARLEPILRETLLASAGKEATKLSLARAESLVLRHGVPLVWAYVGTASGLSVGMPGTWEYDDSPGIDGYDPRLEPWYIDGAAAGDLLWSSGVDENGLGLLMSLTEPVRGRDNRLLGVAAVDLPMRDLIDTLLDIPELAAVGAEALLLDGEGRVQVRSTQKEIARTMTEFVAVPFEDEAVRKAVTTEASGHVTMADGRLAFWTSLGRVGLTYVVIGHEDALRGALPARR